MRATHQRGTRTWSRLLRRLREADQGAVAVEFAMLAPALVLMMVCVADVALGIYYKMRVQNAAQFGTQYAVAHGFDGSTIAAAVKSTSTISNLSVTPAPYQYCGCPTAGTISGIACTSTCADGSWPGLYAVISAQGAYTTMIPYPLFPKSFTFASQATVRVQ